MMPRYQVRKEGCCDDDADFGVSVRRGEDVIPLFYQRGEMYEMEESDTKDAAFDCR